MVASHSVTMQHLASTRTSAPETRKAMPTDPLTPGSLGLITTAEAARLVEVERTTIQQWIKRGYLEPIRNLADLAAYLSAHAPYIRPEQVAPSRGNLLVKAQVIQAKLARSPQDRRSTDDACTDLREAVRALNKACDRLRALGMAEEDIQARIRGTHDWYDEEVNA